ncbi:uncharacterized protein HD556DRAFT_1447766 [Suillus plorans]|uniref:Uncharacterized protein n=1 Tax=Suillus plorans TaxID=116603 RepID=A0A9P7AFX8_9AGAM|nr:uncharacterized protein HD556DRAFT_1447766 [Suillus plorans]KAG1788556.1 hypothetical protein HD556DRAFT_1447766 [Suillus plorans]
MTTFTRLVPIRILTLILALATLATLTEDEPDDEPDDEPQDSNIRATLSKSERTADVRTVFTRNDKEWGAYRNGHLSAAVEAEGHAASLDK